jgi:tetratricopeptide (TPR) repeat protein
MASRRLHVWAFWLSILASLGGITRVAANDPDQRARARVFFQRGVEATARTSYAEALTAFEQAQALRPHPATLYNIALSLWALGRPAAALRELERVLAASDLAVDKRRQAEAQRSDWLGQVGRIRLSFLPRDARVALDGAAMEGTDLLVVAPGWRQVQVRSAGFRGSDHLVYVRPGSLRNLHVALDRATASGSDMAELEVVSFPYGKVWLNGAFAGASPLRLTLPAGAYRVGGGRETIEGELALELGARESRQVVVHWDRAPPTLHEQPDAGGS